MSTVANKFSGAMKRNPVLKAVLCFIALVAMYFGIMGILSALKVVPFEKALEPFRMIMVILACAFSAFRIYAKANRA